MNILTVQAALLLFSLIFSYRENLKDQDNDIKPTTDADSIPRGLSPSFALHCQQFLDQGEEAS